MFTSTQIYHFWDTLTNGDNIRSENWFNYLLERVVIILGSNRLLFFFGTDFHNYNTVAFWSRNML